MHRFYTPQLTARSTRLEISDPGEIHHIRDVLRLGSGQRVELIDGKGLVARGVIADVRAVAVRVNVEEVRTEPARTPRLILACAIPKKGKFENIIEKTTELGVDEIIPLQTQNSDVIIKADKAGRKQERYVQVAVNAAKQCQRATVPGVHPPTPFGAALDLLLPAGPVLMPSLSGDRRPLLTALSGLERSAPWAVLIGPEGDFSAGEYAQAHDRGCLPVSLGPTVLKVETAAITTVAVARLYCDSKDFAE